MCPIIKTMRFTNPPFIIGRLIDWIEFNAVSALFQSCNGGFVICKFITLKIY